MSDRDKKIIIVLLILMITILPYVFYIKNTKVDTQTILTDVEYLQERYNTLQEMNLEREHWEEEIVRLHDAMEVIIESFPAGVDSANYTMFLLQTEYSSDVVFNEITGQYELENPIIFDTVSFGENIELPIATEETDTGYVALTNISEVTYRCYYGGLKHMLAYLMEYVDPMIYSYIDMEFDDKTGVIKGTILLSQYAIAGEGRELPATEFEIDFGGVGIDVDLDDMDLRGNEDVEAGIFGTVITQGVLTEETVVEEGEETPVE